MFCPNCGTQMADDAQFCPSCGKQLAQMARAQFDHGGAVDQPQEEKGLKALGRTMGHMAKLWFLCAIGAIAICAVIGIIVWRVEYADGPKPFDGAKVKAQTIWDTNGLSVEVTKLVSPDADPDYLALKVNNNTGRDLTIRSVSCAINGGSVASSLEQKAENGKATTMKFEMDLHHVDVDHLGIKTPGTLTLELQALDPASWEEVLRSGVLTVNTTKKEEAPPSSFDYFGKKQHLFDREGISVSSFGYVAAVNAPCIGIENASDRSVRVEMRVDRINDREFRQRDKYYNGSTVVQQGAIGVCYAPADFTELQLMDAEGDFEYGNFFPVTSFSGSCTIYDACDGSKIDEIPFDYTESE